MLGEKLSISGVTLSKAPDATSEWVGITERGVIGWGDAEVEIQVIGGPAGPKPEQRKLLEEVLRDFDGFFMLAATEIVNDEDFFQSTEHLKQRTQSICWHCDSSTYDITPKWSFQFTVLLRGDHEMGMFAKFEGKKFVQVIGVD